MSIGEIVTRGMDKAMNEAWELAAEVCELLGTHEYRKWIEGNKTGTSPQPHYAKCAEAIRALKKANQ